MAQPAVSTAFVLTGGGSLGAVQVGMLRALAEAGVSPDIVVGSSVGSVNGVVVAGWPDLSEGVRHLEGIWRGLSGHGVFRGSARGFLSALFGRRSHFFDATALRRLLEEGQPHRRFDDLHRPFAVVAVDGLNGTEVVLDSGPLVEAILASSAIPAVLPPVELDGRLLLDGGLSSNAPIGPAVERGANRVVVLPTGYSCALPGLPRSPLSMLLHAKNLALLADLRTDFALYSDKAHIAVVPPPCPQRSFPSSFKHVEENLEGGYAVARAWIEGGGLDRSEVPPQLDRSHVHTADCPTA
jgi:NTE family protein